MLLIKSTEELNQRAIALLQNNTNIINVGRGGRVRMMVEIINELLGTFYSDLEFNVYMTFVSKATGEFLEMCGELVDCHRTPGESDSNYRYRITHQVYFAKGSNEIALRLRVLSVPGVYDIVMVPFTLGTGSFMVYVLPQDATAGNIVVDEVQKILNEHQAFGVNGKAALPTHLRIKLEITLVLDKVGQTNAAQIKRDVQVAVRNYINSLRVGDELIATQLVSIIKGANPSVVDFIFNSMSIGNKPVLIQNYKPYRDERLYSNLSDITIS